MARKSHPPKLEDLVEKHKRTRSRAPYVAAEKELSLWHERRAASATRRRKSVAARRAKERCLDPVAALATRLLVSSRVRAKKQGVPHTLQMQWVLERLRAGRCECTGLKLSAVPKDKASPWSPSIDRVRAGKGYTPDNCRLVCWAYNCAKNEWGETDLLVLARAITERAHVKETV